MEARTEEWEQYTPLVCLHCCWHKCPAQGKGEEKGQLLAICPETHFQPTENFQLPNIRYVYSWGIFFNHSSRKLKKPCLCFLPLPSVLCRSHIAVRWVGSCLPSFHFFYIPTFTNLLLHEPPLGPPHPIIPYLTPSEINEITTSWLGRSCLLSLPHPTPRHSAITYLFGMGLPHAALAHFPQMFQTLTPPPPREMHSHVT